MKSFSYDDRRRLREHQLDTTLKAGYWCNDQGEQMLRIDAASPTSSRQYVYAEVSHLLGKVATVDVQIEKYFEPDERPGRRPVRPRRR